MRLGLDFGTSNTVGMLRRTDGTSVPLLFDASPLLSSAVHAGADGVLLTGADAHRAALANPAGLESNPKRRIDDGSVWLGERDLPVADLIAAVLARQWAEACRVAGMPEAVVLTHPAAWGPARLAVLAEAARRAGLPPASFVAEPVAAAAYFVGILGRAVPPGRTLVVYDLGAGTFDVSAVRRSSPARPPVSSPARLRLPPAPDGEFEAFATAGLDDVGGLDIDATVVDHVRELTAADPAAWERLDSPRTSADHRARGQLWQGARAAKELLSRHSHADVHVPLVGADLHITREEFEERARRHLDRTVDVTLSVLRSAGVTPEQIAGVFLVGGSSRIPLVATLLQRQLEVAPTVIDQPELVVAHGALHALPAPPALTPPVQIPPPRPRIQVSSRPLPPVQVSPPAPRAAPVAPPAAPPAVQGIPPRGVVPQDFPVHLVELAMGTNIGYTVRTYVTEEDGITLPVFASVAGRLPLFRRPDHAADYAVGTDGHDLCGVLHWDTLSDWMSHAFLPLVDDNRYDIDLPASNLEMEPRQWLIDLILKAGRIATELVETLDIEEGYRLIGPGTRLYQLGEAFQLARRQPWRRHRRHWLGLDRRLLAEQWHWLSEVLESRVDWQD